MGQQRRIKHMQRQLKHMRIKNQRVSTIEMYGVVPIIENTLDEQNAELDPINEKFDEIYEIVIQNLPFFSGINYEGWKTEMKKITMVSRFIAL
jgi:hypothetical protein